MDHRLIIEFVGLPGAGKTTIVDRVIEMERQESLGVSSFWSSLHVERNGSRKNTIARKLLRAAASMDLLLKERGIVRHLLRYALLSRPFSLSRVRPVWSVIRLSQEVGHRRVDERRKHRVELLSQGFLQELGSIALPGGSASSKDLESLVRHASTNWIDGLVWLECSPETSFIRVRNRTRGLSRFDKWPDEVFRHNQIVIRKILSDAVQLAGCAGLPILTISSADPVCMNAIRVRAWLQYLLSSVHRRHSAADSA